MMVEIGHVTIVIIAASLAAMTVGFSIGRIFEIVNDDRIKARRMRELADKAKHRSAKKD